MRSQKNYTIDGKSARLKGYFADSSAVNVFDLAILIGIIACILRRSHRPPCYNGFYISSIQPPVDRYPRFRNRPALRSVPRPFYLSPGLTLLVALLTIGFRCWRTARINPVRSLRAE